MASPTNLVTPRLACWTLLRAVPSRRPQEDIDEDSPPILARVVVQRALSRPPPLLEADPIRDILLPPVVILRCRVLSVAPRRLTLRRVVLRVLTVVRLRVVTYLVVPAPSKHLVQALAFRTCRSVEAPLSPVTVCSCLFNRRRAVWTLVLPLVIPVLVLLTRRPTAVTRLPNADSRLLNRATRPIIPLTRELSRPPCRRSVDKLESVPVRPAPTLPLPPLSVVSRRLNLSRALVVIAKLSTTEVSTTNDSIVVNKS